MEKSFREFSMRKIGIDKQGTPLYLSETGHIYFGCSIIPTSKKKRTKDNFRRNKARHNSEYERDNK